MDRFNNPKFITALVVTGLAVIVFLQNRQPIVLSVLFLAKVETALATALCTAFLIGAVTGGLAVSRWSQRNRTKDAASSQA